MPDPYTENSCNHTRASNETVELILRGKVLPIVRGVGAGTYGTLGDASLLLCPACAVHINVYHL